MSRLFVELGVLAAVKGRPWRVVCPTASSMPAKRCKALARGFRFSFSLSLHQSAP